VKNIIRPDFSSSSGGFLEKYFTKKLILEMNYSEIGIYLGKGKNNEIDIVA
jgi:hypothetical protein